jgi:hypothetical protein
LYYKKHTNINETPYKITIKYGDNTKEVIGIIKSEDNTIPIYTFTLGNTESQNPPPTGRSREDLLRERERLQEQLDQINNELESFRINEKINK